MGVEIAVISGERSSATCFRTCVTVHCQYCRWFTMSVLILVRITAHLLGTRDVTSTQSPNIVTSVWAGPRSSWEVRCPQALVVPSPEGGWGQGWAHLLWDVGENDHYRIQEVYPSLSRSWLEWSIPGRTETRRIHRQKLFAHRGEFQALTLSRLGVPQGRLYQSLRKVSTSKETPLLYLSRQWERMGKWAWRDSSLKALDLWKTGFLLKSASFPKFLTAHKRHTVVTIMVRHCCVSLTQVLPLLWLRQFVPPRKPTWHSVLIVS